MERRYIRRVFLNRPVPEDSYLRRLPAVRYLLEGKTLDFDNDVTFLVGENGTGKSTLLEAVAVAYGFNPEGGTRNFRFHLCHPFASVRLSDAGKGRLCQGWFFSAGGKPLQRGYQH